MLLIIKVLADPLCHRDGGTLELDNPERDPVDIEHQIGTLLVFPGYRHLFSDGEIVGLGFLPVH